MRNLDYLLSRCESDSEIRSVIGNIETDNTILLLQLLLVAPYLFGQRVNVLVHVVYVQAQLRDELCLRLYEVVALGYAAPEREAARNHAEEEGVYDPEREAREDDGVGHLRDLDLVVEPRFTPRLDEAYPPEPAPEAEARRVYVAA